MISTAFLTSLLKHKSTNTDSNNFYHMN